MGSRPHLRVAHLRSHHGRNDCGRFWPHAAYIPGGRCSGRRSSVRSHRGTDRQADPAVTALAPSRGLALARPMRWGAGLPLTDTAIDSSFVLPAGTVTFVLTDIEG